MPAARASRTFLTPLYNNLPLDRCVEFTSNPWTETKACGYPAGEAGGVVPGGRGPERAQERAQGSGGAGSQGAARMVPCYLPASASGLAWDHMLYVVGNHQMGHAGFWGGLRRLAAAGGEGQ